ncbi:dual specificity protein phosphatase 22 isoform X3 [Pongo pygmaeus]|uniref:dual specificity protein phosphatase 22 isoform X3 n=1 Tax=Pongo pygmaeus TaxID=9600 RepID=UPI00300CA532
MGNGMNKILPGLYIGNFKDARDAEQLSKNKVTHILSVHDSARPMLEGVKYLCIPAADSPSQNLTRHFKESIKFIHECRLRGESCLVHCLAGVSRSVTLVIAYIMTVTDFGWEDALHTVRAGRSCANPNVGFQRQLQEFEKHEVHQSQVQAHVDADVHVCDVSDLFPSSPVSAVAEGRIWREPFAGCRRSQKHSGVDAAIL